MISRVIVTTEPNAVSQRAWDDFCHARGLVLQPSGYFKSESGLRAGCQKGRVSFFSRTTGYPSVTTDLLALYAGKFIAEFGGRITRTDNMPVSLVGA